MTGDDPRLALQRGFIAALALTLTVIFLWMIKDFLSALFLAAVLAIFLFPLQRRLTRLFKGRKAPAASLVLIIAVFAVLIPLLALLTLVAQQAVEVGQTFIPWLQEQIRNFRAEGLAGLPDWLPFKDALAPYQAEIAQRLTETVAGLGGVVIDGVRRAGGGALSFVLNTAILLFALYYLLTSGPGAMKSGMDLLPMRPHDRELLAERTLSTIRATVKGTFVIAVIQGVLTGIGLAVAGVPGSAFWGAVAGILSIIPGIGPPLVWLPAAIWLWVTGSPVPAVALAAWGALVVGVIDNLLRPILVGQDAKMSDVLVLLSTLGGLTLFGAVGIIVGPLIAALFTSAWYIYAESYKDLLAAQDKSESG
ncbi:MAG: AI-2E family transporter [Alphaproteobacteria bacterium]|nr:AI-2E family transporter [Alphaproteobacteria bacterium]